MQAWHRTIRPHRRTWPDDMLRIWLKPLWITVVWSTYTAFLDKPKSVSISVFRGFYSNNQRNWPFGTASPVNKARSAMGNSAHIPHSHQLRVPPIDIRTFGGNSPKSVAQAHLPSIVLLIDPSLNAKAHRSSQFCHVFLLCI